MVDVVVENMENVHVLKTNIDAFIQDQEWLFQPIVVEASDWFDVAMLQVIRFIVTASPRTAVKGGRTWTCRYGERYGWRWRTSSSSSCWEEVEGGVSDVGFVGDDGEEEEELVDEEDVADR